MDNLETAFAELHKLLEAMLKNNGSDLFITAGFPPAMKCKGEVVLLAQDPLTPEESYHLTICMMNEKQRKVFESHQEANFAIAPADLGRFRVNAFVQQGFQGSVIRVIAAQIPTINGLGLPETLKNIVMGKNGLIIMVGATGSGKSTSMAAMINHRNENSRHHIITLEDPIEYVHKPKNCVITQREIGVDTQNWNIALQNTLRQSPDVILLGEIRSQEIMEVCLELSQTGHLVLATLHANNANNAIDRILSFFDKNAQKKLMQDIAVNLRAIVSQRLIKTTQKTRCAAIEVLLNTPLLQEMIAKGDFDGIKPLMARSRELGMQTFDQAVFDLYQQGKIGYDEALQNADSANEVRLKIKLAANDNSAPTFSLKAKEDDYGYFEEE